MWKQAMGKTSKSGYLLKCIWSKTRLEALHDIYKVVRLSVNYMFHNTASYNFLLFIYPTQVMKLLTEWP